MSGLNESWVDAHATYPLECVVDQVKPKARIYWSINGELQNDTDTKVEGPEGEIQKLIGSWTHQFMYHPGNQQVKCVITDWDDKDEVLLEMAYKMVTVWCK